MKLGLLAVDGRRSHRHDKSKLIKTLDEIEKDAIRERLEQFHNDIARTAKSLGVNRTKIYRFLDIERARQQTS